MLLLYINTPLRKHIRIPMMSTMKFTYLDWAATAPPDREALEYGLEVAAETYANPSALHGPGKLAAGRLAEFRQRIAKVVGCRAEQLYFTSGGTESNNIVFSQLLLRPKKEGLLLSPIEHPSVWQNGETFARLGFPLNRLRCGADGRVDPEQAAARLTPETGFVSLMLVNNETGAIQDVAGLSRRIAELRQGGKKPHLHTDGVQALGKIPVDLTALGVDSASFSGHKIGAPRGIGLLYLKKREPALFSGGGQEQAMRPGTENLPGIAALTLALEKRTEDMENALAHAKRLKEQLVEGVARLPGACFLPHGADPLGPASSPYLLKCAFPGLPGEVIQRVLSDRGYCVSTGSACSSSAKKNHRVLEAMGVKREVADSSIRISWGPATDETEIEGFLQAAARALTTLKEIP